MNEFKRGLLVFLLIISGCHSSRALTPEETGEMLYGLWGFVFFTPNALFADVNYVAIIDEKKVLYSFRTLDSVNDDSSSVGRWDTRYMRFAQFNKARHPPRAMLICWDSVIDKKTYETHIIFPESVREKMSISTGIDRLGGHAWYSTILFGLAPEGKVRIWLQNSGGGDGDNLSVEPKKITTFSGDKLDGCKGITNHSQGYGYTKSTREFIKGKTYPYGEW
ncbi:MULTISPECIES: DUF2931 family protein [Enterobacterales]|uniref:DUF2931 family protein n=1 Tax=Enterobacterales TaxID=91347 RepID=UPI002EDA91ED